MAETLQGYTGKSAGSSTVKHGCVYEVLSMSAYASASFCLCTSVFAYLMCLCETNINVTFSVEYGGAQGSGLHRSFPPQSCQHLHTGPPGLHLCPG